MHFHELYFLPDVPELTDVNAVLKNYTEGSHRFVLCPCTEQDLTRLSSKTISSRRQVDKEAIDLLRVQHFFLHVQPALIRYLSI